MNICQVTPVYLPANLTGSGKYVQYLSEGLASKGHRVTVHTSIALSGEAFYNPFSRKFCRKRTEIINGVYVYRHKVHHFFSCRNKNTFCPICEIYKMVHSQRIIK